MGGFEQVAVTIEEAATTPACRAMAETLIGVPFLAAFFTAVATRWRRLSVSA
ncbi:hypothetical protein ACIQ7Q_15815 [Streptomyces sp. NPDC096176]|uniref:hypothetical protein n=1 Tax=Streptomyces sp. NPDC096176 TaxID=3366079 RepID=UPI0037F93AB7